MNMSNKRKKYSAQEKVRLLRLHLIEKEPVSDICDRHGLNPNVFYRWQKVFFENGAAAFNQTGNGHKDGHAKKLERQNAQLKAKLAGKDEVIAEIMASHVQLKKSLGEV
jgi:transposase